MTRNESYSSLQMREKYFSFSQYISKLFCFLNLLMALDIAQKHYDLVATAPTD